MKKITMDDLRAAGAMRLSCDMLYRMDSSLIERDSIDDVMELIDRLEGSRVELYLVPSPTYCSGVSLQLCCGEHKCEEEYSPYCLSEVIKLAPFIAACAGRLEEEPEPSKLEELERRISRLEEHAGLGIPTEVPGEEE